MGWSVSETIGMGVYNAKGLTRMALDAGDGVVRQGQILWVGLSPPRN